MDTAPATREVSLDRVMEAANQRYAELVGSPLHKIESRQVRSLAVALVAETNRVLAGMQAQYDTQLNFLASALKDLDEAVDRKQDAIVAGQPLGAPGE